ncbi:glycerophosphoryl diester phosphodiesterase [Actimicrobium sp. GrIS 1.19]|uniref:glycerophosphodiester phosphodiesterase n=1 Tax=Actimicrobium sp. GrIS 1.19 TaxID=3071708 RepID=UPI002E03EDDB|nr:glycerophosphoryl diester phosphodiesterase [Actimicrobium sp. GrIS 1.19]
MTARWPFPRIVAHRGGGSLAPENTIAALRCGLAHGFHAVEFDVMLSQDGVPILMHDAQFGRTVRAGGSVSTATAAELAAMDAGSWFSDAFVGEPVPTYRQAFSFCAEHGIWMNVEIKPAAGFEQITGATVAALTQEWVAAEQAVPLLSSFSYAAMLAAKQAAPGIPRGWLVDRIPDDWLARLRQLGAVALHANQANLTAAQAAAVSAAGFGLFCYTVNTPERARTLLEWGVNGFCTDRIDLIDARFS